MQQKKIIIIAGPNGAGKTTFARQFLPNEADTTIAMIYSNYLKKVKTRDDSYFPTT